MRYISTPLSLKENDNNSEIRISREIEKRTVMLDNLIDLIVLSPQGSFNADPDFGLPYWDLEYANVNDIQFNNDGMVNDGFYNESIRRTCEESIKKTLMAYAPDLKDVHISMNLDAAGTTMQGRRKVKSRHMVTILAEGHIDDGLGTAPYQKEVSFLVEPASKKFRI